MEQGRSTSLRLSNKSNKLVPRELTEGLGKLPPQALDLEEAVLGALMLEKNALNAVVEFLKPEHFYSEVHKEIYTAIVELFKSTEPVDMRTVVNQLRKTGKLELVGGAYYIAELTAKVSSAANIEYHARVIIEMAIKRDLITIASQMQHDAYEDTTDVFELLDKTEQSIFEISESNLKKNYDNMRNLMARAIQELQVLKEHQDGLTGVPSGFTELDRMTSGWQKSDLVIIAARPGMGKCLGKGTRVLMFDGQLKNVEDVVTGDLLMGDDSTPRRVLSIARGRENMYWVHQHYGISYRVNESHILSLKRSRYTDTPNSGEVLNIEVRDYLQHSAEFKARHKGYKVAVEFDEKPLSSDPYLMGLQLGNRPAVDFFPAVPETAELTWYDRPERMSPRYQRDLYAPAGMLNAQENNPIPQEFLVNSTENRLQLLAGLLDAIGHYDGEHHVFEMTSDNEAFARQVKFLCDTLGFRTSWREKKPDPITPGGYTIRISGDVEKIPVKADANRVQDANAIVNWRHTGIEVEFDKVDDYYGFEIDGNRLFLLEDMTVTHNTAFVVSALRNAAVDFKIPVALFSLEMASIQLVNRMISAEAELESEKIKKGNLAEHEWAQLVHKTSRLSSAPIFIDDTPAISILELRAKCRRLKAEHGVQIIVIDYLQLMRGDQGGNREQEIASISRSLKGIAKELSVPVLALSQLSRGVETRGGDKKPQLSDLRESGSIEQDADIVMFLYRPEYYKITVDEEGMPTQGTGEVIIAKHRNGSTGSVKLKFIGKYTKFADLDSPSSYDNPFSGMITRESRLNAFNDEGAAPPPPPPANEDDAPF